MIDVTTGYLKRPHVQTSFRRVQAGGERYVELAGGRSEDHVRSRDGNPLSRWQPLAGCDGGGAEDEPLALSALCQGGWDAPCVGPRPARRGAGTEADS